MSVRKVLFASVCSVFLAASAAASGAAAAQSDGKLVGEAYKTLQTGDAASAVTAYTKAIESRALSPEVLANALLNRGLAYQRLNEHEMAVDDYTAAMRIDAMSAKLRALALYNRGLSYQRLQKNALAIEDFTSALFLDSQFAHAYYSRGTLLRDGGQHLFALADFDKALRFNYPDQARVYFAQSLTYEKLRRTADAREALDKALSANPRYEPAVQRLAALDGKRAAPPATGAADQISTAAVTPAVATALPEASAPSQAVLDEGGDASATEVTEDLAGKKKFTDRIEPSERVVATAPVKMKPKAEAADAVVEATAAVADEAEKIIAVETVPDEAAAAGPETAEAAPADAEVEPANAAPPEQQVQKGWSVQLASAGTEDAAWSTWKKMQAKNKALSSKTPVVVRADLGSKGVFYRVRLVGFDTQDAANGECAKLKRKGVRCYISKASS
jgi:tetratricopeptide (TPR) repeat protein